MRARAASWIAFTASVALLAACSRANYSAPQGGGAPGNTPPIANAGPDQSAPENTRVTLSGTASDPDGNVVSVLWTQLSGDSVTLSNRNSNTATFTAPSINTPTKTLTFEFRARDNRGAETADQVTITVTDVAAGNLPPVVNAGPDQSVQESTSVTLAGSASDPDGSIASTHWTQTGGQAVTLSNANALNPTFTAPAVSGAPVNLTFQLAATDNQGAQASDSVTVTVNRAPPRSSVSIASKTASETAGVIGFPLTINPASASPITVHFKTADGTARSPADYAGTSDGTITIPANATTATLPIAIVNDTFDENDETFTVTLTSASGSATLGTATATGTIQDDDDSNLLRVGAAKHSIQPCDVTVTGIPGDCFQLKDHIAGVDEERAYGAGTHHQQFNLGGFGINLGQNLPDPGQDIPGAITTTEPATRRVFKDKAGVEENTNLRLFVIRQKGDASCDQPANGAPATVETCTGGTVVFAMIDAIGAGNLIVQGAKNAIIAAAASKGVTIAPENILFGMTHSHTAADLQGLWGGVPQDWVENILYKAAGAAMTDALASMQPAHVSFKQGYTSDFNNYRRPRIDPNADADGTITLLSAVADDGTPIGNILQYNAHPTSVGDGVPHRTSHSEYILGAMDWLEHATTGPGGVSLYYNGPIADASPSGSRAGCVNRENNDEDSRPFGDVRCRGEGIADYLLHADHVLAGHELAPSLVARSTTVVLPITNPAFAALAPVGSFNRYYNFTQLPTDQIPFLTKEQQQDLPQLAPIATTTVSRITLGGENTGLEIVSIPGETTNTNGDYIRGLAKTNVMLLGLTHNSFGYILPEQEFSYVAQDGDDGFVLPFTGYEEFVSLGPLTATLLRAEGYNQLFSASPEKNVPPALSSCLDASGPTTCELIVLQERLNLAIESVENCFENGLTGQGCPFANLLDFIGIGEGTLPGAGPIDEPVIDTRLGQASADAALRGCDILDSSECLFPFPSDHFLVPAAADSPQGVNNGGTGKRVNFNPLAMPRNAVGKPIDPTEWNRQDGFSPGQLIVTYVPNIGTVKDANHKPLGPIRGAVPINDLARYADANAPILVIDTVTGQRHPIYAEIDLNAGYLLPMQGFGPRADKKPALLIRPSKNFVEGRRYVVALRNLVNDYGQPIPAGPAFTACRDRSLDALAAMPVIQQRCAELSSDKVWDTLSAAGVARDSHLYLAWDFTVASRKNDTGRIVAMRDDAFASLGDVQGSAPGDAGYPAGDAPKFSITKVTPNPDDKTVRRIQGTFTVPSYVTPADPAPLRSDDNFKQFIDGLRSAQQAPGVSDALNALRQQCNDSGADPLGVVCDLFDVGGGAETAAGLSLPPNRLNYLPDGSNPCDGLSPQDIATSQCALQARWGNGKPVRNPLGDITVPFTCNIPRSAISNKAIESATAQDVKPVRPTLYGHGLLGGQGEGNGQASDWGNRYGFMVCAADWFGFASGDIGTVASALVDLSNFPAVPDGAQQGVLNQLFLARLLVHPDGFAKDANFRVAGKPVFDHREVFYDGNSQGGIMGGVVVAASKDVNRGVLGVLGMNYSTLLARSTDFATYSIPLYLAYQDDLERPFVLSLMQMLWDRSENDGYAGSLTDNSAMGGPDNQLLLTPAYGDHQVTMFSADVMARTIGASVDRRRLTDERKNAAGFPLDPNAEVMLPRMDYANPAQTKGSALVYYDQIWETTNPDRRCTTATKTDSPPIGNLPPNQSNLGAGAPFEDPSIEHDRGNDPHECPRRDPQARCQMSHFLQRTQGVAPGDTSGTLIDPALQSRQTDDYSGGCPAVINTVPESTDTVVTPPPPPSQNPIVAAVTGFLDRLSSGDVQGAIAALQGGAGDTIGQVARTLAGLIGKNAGPDGVWLRGDLHVHDDHSADGSGTRQGIGQGAPGNVSLADQLMFGGTQRLDFMNFNDHRTFDQHYDPLWRSGSMLLITGEEANGRPHANVFGAVDMISQTDNPPDVPQFRWLQQSIWDAHAQGAAWQTNHPDDGEVQTDKGDGTVVTNNFAEATGPDLCEIWNRGTRNSTKIAYCENRWNAGWRMGIAGASDNHFKELWPIAGPGTPLTHVFAAEKSTPALLDALRAGRTAININDRGPFVTLTGDFDGDGKFETVGGDEVHLAAGHTATLRVTIDNGAGATINVYRNPGKTAGAFQSFQSTAGAEQFDFTITGDAAKPNDWYRVEVRGPGEPDAAAYQDPTNPVDQDAPMRAITAPIFVSTGAFASPESPQLPVDRGAADGATPLFGEATDNAFAGFADVAESNGIVHAVAEVRAHHANHVLYRARRADGTLTQPFDLSPGSKLARQPTIAASGNDVWVAWQDEHSGELPHNPQIFLRHSRDGGATWATELQVSDSAARAQRPDLALINDATPVVVWEDNTGGAFDVLARVIGRDAAPVNLSAAGKTVTPGNGIDSRSAIYPASVSPKVAVRADGAIAVAWQDNRNDVDPGWTGHTEMPEELAADQPARCAAEFQRAASERDQPDQNECVFSERGTEMDDWEIFAATFNGTTWSAPADVSNSPTQADRHATVAFDAAGTLHAAWDSKQASPAGPRLEIRTSQLNGTSWSAPQSVAKTASYSSQRPTFGHHGTALSLFWMDGRSADWRWRVRRADLSGSAWLDRDFVTGRGNGTWPSYDNGWLAFTSDRAATREQRKPQQVYLLALNEQPVADADGDGVPDGSDQCPTVAGPASNNGCPVVTPTDTDGDGIPDASDQCPTQAGPASNNGCPIVTPPDADGDGVPDASDNCPDTPAGTTVDANGCPVTQPSGFPLCEPVSGDNHCISELGAPGEAIQGFVDLVYNTIVGGGTPGGVPNDPTDPLVLNCTGPAGDPEEGTPEFAARDAMNMACTHQRNLDTMRHPANYQYMLQNYGGDPYRAPDRFNNTRWRHATTTIKGGNVDVFMPCDASCTHMPAGLQRFEPPYPVAIVMHGLASDKRHLEWASEPLAERGYFVVAINGSTSTPDSPPTAGTGANVPHDVIDWLKDPANTFKANLDLTRIGATGHSLGAENSTRFEGETGKYKIDAIVAYDPCDGGPGPLLTCTESAGSKLHDTGAAAQTPALVIAADYVGFPGYPQPQTSNPNDLRAESYGILRNNHVDTMLLTTRATTHLDFAGAFTFGNRLNEATSLYYTLAWFDRYVKGKLVVDGTGNVVTTGGRDETQERAYRQAIANDAFAHLTASKFDGRVDLHNISQGYFDPVQAAQSGDPMYGGNVPYRVKDLALADRLSFYHRSVCYVSRPDLMTGNGSTVLARADTTEAGDMRKNGCIVTQAPPPDADGDGVPDASDLCAGTPPGTTVDASGCPVVTPPDADGDGVADANDNCPNTPAGTTVDEHGCPVEQAGDSFPLCDPFFDSGYCITTLDQYVPVGLGRAIQDAANTAYDTVTGGGGQPPPPPPASAASIFGCAASQNPDECNAAVSALATELQGCHFDGLPAAMAEAFSKFDQGPITDFVGSAGNCGYETLSDRIGVSEAATFLRALIEQCYTSPAEPACSAIRSIPDSDAADTASVAVLSKPIPRGDLVYAEAGTATLSPKTVDGHIGDWVGAGTRIGGTDIYAHGEHVYTDFLFDAFGADKGDDARRWAALALLGEATSRSERVDALQQAANDQLDVPPPAGTGDGDHYGNGANREDGTDLTEVRWAGEGDNIYFLARVSRLLSAANLHVLVLADTQAGAGSHLADLVPGLQTQVFDRAVVLGSGAPRIVDLTTGANLPSTGTFSATSTDDKALEAELPRSLLARADGTIRVAVMTARANADGTFTPANVAYRFDEPVTIYSERTQALSLFAGTVDAFTKQISLADLASGRTQTAKPGFGYHERQFLSGANISNDADAENGRLQPYGIFIPHGVPGDVVNPARMTIWTHYRGGKTHSGAAWTPRLFWELGEEQHNLVVSPRGRGTSTWYTTRAHQDFFEVFADVAGKKRLNQAVENLGSPADFGTDGLFEVDRAHIYVSGYSMGGYATYLFTGLYPDLFAGGFSQSGAVTQGAWTGIGPEDPQCVTPAQEIPVEGDPGNVCFIEANEGRADAQLNWRLLENTREVPLEINHGTNDELALTPGAVQMGQRLNDLGYRYDQMLLIGYEHFTQAIVDEWRDGAHYINRFASPENPRHVTYKVVPALVKAINEVHAWDTPGATFHFNPDGAYWVDDLVVRDGADGSIPTDTGAVPFGQIDAESQRIAGSDHVAVPRTGSDVDDPSSPYISTPAYSPGNHTTPFIRRGNEWIDTTPLAGANAFNATLTNLTHATLDLARMGFVGQYANATIEGSVTSDGAATLTLTHVGADVSVCVNGAKTGSAAAGGSATLAIASGANDFSLVPGASCGSVTPPPVSNNSPALSGVCASYGIPNSEPACAALLDVETQLREGCEQGGGPAEFCTLANGNLHAVLDSCYAQTGGVPSEQRDGLPLPLCRTVDTFVQGAAGYCRQLSLASGDALKAETCALVGGVVVSERAIERYESSWVHKALALQSRLGYGLGLLRNTLLHTHNSFNATDENTPPTLSGSDFNQYYNVRDQLRMDIRAIEVDVHWRPGPQGTVATQGYEPMVCHAQTVAPSDYGAPTPGSVAIDDVGCTYEKPLSAELAEIRAWLDAHPDEQILLYIEDHLAEPGDDTSVSYPTTAAVFEQYLGNLVFRPAQHGSTCSADAGANDANAWTRVSRAQMASAGKQVLMISESCGGDDWDQLFHAKKDSNVHQGTQSSFENFSYEKGCQLHDDATFVTASRGKRLTRVWEDSTWLTSTPEPGGGTPASVTPAVMHELMRCGMSLPGVDRLTPGDGRLEAAVWSWAKDEPVASDTLNCAALNADGRFVAKSCNEYRPFACVSDTDPNHWTVEGAASPWSFGGGACSAGSHFGVPANGYANEQLKAAAAGREVWLNYTDASGDGKWIGDAGAAPAGPAVAPPQGQGSACTDLGVPAAICNVLNSAIDALTARVADVVGPAPVDPLLQQCRDAGVSDQLCAQATQLSGAYGLSRYVDPRIGSFPPGFTNPGPTAPYGMVQPGPDTEGPLNFGGYYFHNTLVSGFSQVHMSAGVYKAGYFPMLPFTGELTSGQIPDDHLMPAYSSGLDHSLESADAGYYTAVLTRYAARAELTATERAAFHRYTFLDPTQAPRVLIDVARMNGTRYRSGVAHVTGDVVSGRIDADFPVFFAARFSSPFSARTFAGDKLDATPAALTADNSGVILDFSGMPSTVQVKIGVSYTDEAGALANLDAEIPGWDFDAVRAATRAKWDDALKRIEVEGGTIGDLVSFYTALYHAQQFPNVHSDVDGRYRGPDGATHSGDPAHPHYSQFSSWDSYRAQNQVQAEIVPALYDDMIQSLIDFGEQNGGVMPRWQEGSHDASHMTGDPIIPFIGEAWCRGALSAATRDKVWPLLLNLPQHRDDFLKANGYQPVEPIEQLQPPQPHDYYEPFPEIPSSTGVAPVENARSLLAESQDAANPTGGAAASETLEYGIADFSLALMAQTAAPAEADAIAQRSLNYRKLMDPETKWIRPRLADGSWMTPFQPEIGYGFQEGTSWQYSWMVMHDYGGVFAGMGGEAAAEQRLDTFFNLPADLATPIVWPTVQNQVTLFGISYVGNQYAPGNEHDLEAAYVYNYLGAPWKTQAVARAAGSIYTPTINGMPGNDDLGALSGWLVWNMAGVYPMNPGTPLFVVGSPVFEKVTFHRPTGDLVIEAPGASATNKYVQSVSINGTPSAQSWLIVPREATTVHVEMGAGPNLDWGKAAYARPPSISTSNLSAFGCGTTAPAQAPAPTVSITPTSVSVSNGEVSRSWSRKPFRTTELKDARTGKVWSQGSADFALSLGGAEIASDRFNVSGEPQVQKLANGVVRITFKLTPAGLGVPAGLTITRTVETYPDVAGMRSETWLSSSVPLVLSGYSLDESRPSGSALTGTIHSFRAGADWREPTWSGPESPQEPFPAPVIGDAHGGDWRDTHTGASVSGTAQWLSVGDAQAGSLFYVMERNDYASSMMSFTGGRARAHVDLSRDIIYTGPIEESAHVENPLPAGTKAGGRVRAIVPGVPLRLEPVFTGIGASRDDEPWQHYKYLTQYRMPHYRREITFNSNGVDGNRISTGAKDDMDLAETQRQADIARQLGIETFVLDDGWQARSGDWCPDSDSGDPACVEPRRADGSEPKVSQPRFPDSSFEAVRAALAPGRMNLGLWMSPLHFNPSAVAFQNNPQWLCQPIGEALLALQESDPYGGSQEAGLLQWNPEASGSNGKAIDYIEDRIRRAIDQWGVKYFKFDFTVWLDCAGVNTVDMYGYRESFMAMLDRVLKDHPDVTIQMDETNDYRLFPFEAIARGPTWYQNGSPNTSEALHANHVLAPFVPLYSLGRNALRAGALGTDSVDYQMAVALLSHMTFFNDLTQIPEAARPRIRVWTDYFRANRDALAAFAYPLSESDPLDPSVWAVFQTWNPETGRGALLAYRQDSNQAVKQVRLRNVPAGTYRLWQAPDETQSFDVSAEQLRAGIDIELTAKRTAKVLRIERVN